MERKSTTLDMASKIITAYVGNNTVKAEEIPSLIQKVLVELSNITASGSGDHKRPDPAVPVQRSIKSDVLVCLEDGLRFKSLKRHLNASHGMTAEQYRARWNLPRDYPMVAPNYAVRRAKIAREMGLGWYSRVLEESQQADISVEDAAETGVSSEHSVVKLRRAG